MPIEQCYPFNLPSLASMAFDCFALDKSAPKYFGFAEFISGLALTLVVWTIADLSYKFRIETAALPVKRASVVITIIVGTLALLTDYWRASESRVPLGGFLTPESWQLLMGSSFFSVLAVWLFLAFLRPVRFSAWNAKKFALIVESYLLRGSRTELAIIGDELARSAARIINYVPDFAGSVKKITTTQARATWLLMAVGSPKFCRAVVEGSPKLIINLFNAVDGQRKYSDEIKIIARNLVTAAIENRNSFLYHEQDLYESGLEGITRPVTTALCQSAELVRRIDTLLNPEYSRQSPWDIEQWKAYFRLVLQAFTVHVDGGSSASRPSSLHLAYIRVKGIYSDLNEDLQLTDLRLNDGLDLRLSTLGMLIKDMVMVLDNLDHHGKAYADHASEDIAHIIFSLIRAASSFRKPRRVSRRIQERLIWNDILNSGELHTTAGVKTLKLVHSMLWNSIIKSPNLDSVRLLGFCLNVMGFTPSDSDDGCGSTWRDLHVDLIDWVTLRIASLLKAYPRMARECFVDGMYYEEDQSRLVIHYAADDGGEGDFEYLKVAPATE